MTALRIGLIGAGANTRTMHIPGFRKLPDIEISAVANRSHESGERVAKEFDIPRVYDSVEELLADPAIDAVCIGTWPYKHREYTIGALEAGKHVLCEARMAMDLAQAEDMLAAHERHPELVAQLVPAPFDFQLGPTVTRLINDGALGEVLEVTVTALNGSSLNPATPIHWRQRMQYSGRNVGMLGIYAEVVQRWLGDTTHVVADGTIVTASRPDAETGQPVTVDVPDSFGVLARMANGARASYQISGVAAGAPANGIVLFGSKATIRWAPGESATMAEHGKPFEAIEADPGTDRGWRVEEDFVASVREGAPVRLTSFADGVRYMRFVDAAWRSWDEGRAIEITPG
jgi:predicted dehydrogenase